MDSLYKQYPVGSILLWRTSQRLKRENRLGVFKLPEPEKDYPIDYVLDGQQRLTSIFTTFQLELTQSLEDPDLWLPIYYDFDAEGDAQDSRFVALKQNEVDPDRHFPLKTFFDPVEFSIATRNLSSVRHREIAGVQQRFLTTLLPVQTFETEDRTSVAIVFERVNRMGIALDTYQLLTAWTWSDEFDLQQRFESLAEEFESFGFRDVGDDSDLMMRCCASVLQHDSSPASLVDVSGADVRDRFDDVENAIRRSVDFLRGNFGVRHVKFLPYSSLLIPLVAFFSFKAGKSVTDDQRRMLTHWFWKSCFSHRYSGNPQRNIDRDIVEAVKMGRGEESKLADVFVRISGAYFLSNTFSFRTVASKTAILLLAAGTPRSFLSGELVPLEDVLAEPNRREYHHCFPRAYLAKQDVPSKVANTLANIAMISRAENREISDKAPSVYRKLMPANISEIQRSAYLPDSLFFDDFSMFMIERVKLLTRAARNLAGLEDDNSVIGEEWDDVVLRMSWDPSGTSLSELVDRISKRIID